MIIMSCHDFNLLNYKGRISLTTLEQNFNIHNLIKHGLNCYISYLGWHFLHEIKQATIFSPRLK